MNKVKKLEIQTAPLFDLSKVQFLEKLGEGAFGKVRLAKKIKDLDSSTDTDENNSTEQEKNNKNEEGSSKEQLVAIKILSKQQVIKAKQVDHVFNEMSIQAQLCHPFIVNLEGIQQDNRSLYIMLEYIAAGELFRLVQRFNHLETALAKFYASQIILVFEYLHAKSLVYRDLKPENVLINSTGYLKLSDFGFIKQLKPGERTYTLCGTPEYLAPEILTNKGHGKAVDWYCLGIFIYEIMVGRCPFMNDDPYEIFKMILTEKIKFPKFFDSSAKSLIRHLTDHDLSRRYGNLKYGSEDVKNHRFFKDVSFLSILNQKVKPPYVPQPNKKKLDNYKNGVMSSMIPENKNHEKSPPINPQVDPFINWF